MDRAINFALIVLIVLAALPLGVILALVIGLLLLKAELAA